MDQRQIQPKLQQMARNELDAELHTKFSPDLIASFRSRIVLTSDVSIDALKAFIASAHNRLFLRNAPDLSRLVAIP